MERRLLRAIMNPAMIVVWITGPLLAWRMGMWMDGWLHAKFALVVRADRLPPPAVALAQGVREPAAAPHDARFFRMVNEVPTMLMMGIVVLVVVKPW